MGRQTDSTLWGAPQALQKVVRKEFYVRQAYVRASLKSGAQMAWQSQVFVAGFIVGMHLHAMHSFPTLDISRIKLSQGYMRAHLFAEAIRQRHCPNRCKDQRHHRKYKNYSAQSGSYFSNQTCLLSYPPGGIWNLYDKTTVARNPSRPDKATKTR